MSTSLSTMGEGDRWLRTQPIACEWGGFESDTYRMQRGGWEFAIETSHTMRHFERETQVIARHRQYGWAFMGVAHGLNDELHSTFSRGYSEPQMRHARIIFNVMRPDNQIRIQQYAPIQTMYRRVDMEPRMVREVELHRTGLFAPWTEPATQELIVRPEQVSELLERISKLQEPELQAIRERNRLRDLSERTPEIRHATILSIAA